MLIPQCLLMEFIYCITHRPNSTHSPSSPFKIWRHSFTLQWCAVCTWRFYYSSGVRGSPLVLVSLSSSLSFMGARVRTKRDEEFGRFVRARGAISVTHPNQPPAGGQNPNLRQQIHGPGRCGYPTFTFLFSSRPCFRVKKAHKMRLKKFMP